MAYVIASPSGRIKQVYNGNIQNEPGGGVFVSGFVDHVDGEYFDGTAMAQATAVAVTVDKTRILADGIDAATVSGLPDPCWILRDGVETQITGGSYAVTSSASGAVKVELIGAHRGGVVVNAYDLAALKAQAADRIDAAAESTRLKYITGGSGQAMVYQQKSDEAKTYTAATSPVDTDYPLLNAEATATGVTVAALASSVNTLTTQWIALAAQIEGLRMGAKKNVTNATTIDAVLAAEQVNWP